MLKRCWPTECYVHTYQSSPAPTFYSVQRANLDAMQLLDFADEILLQTCNHLNRQRILSLILSYRRLYDSAHQSLHRDVHLGFSKDSWPHENFDLFVKCVDECLHRRSWVQSLSSNWGSLSNSEPLQKSFDLMLRLKETCALGSIKHNDFSLFPSDAEFQRRADSLNPSQLLIQHKLTANLQSLTIVKLKILTADICCFWTCQELSTCQ